MSEGVMLQQFQLTIVNNYFCFVFVLHLCGFSSKCVS